jgi:hypothetical protein
MPDYQILYRYEEIKLLSVATEIQQWVPFALFPGYKIFLTAVNNIKVR